MKEICWEGKLIEFKEIWKEMELGLSHLFLSWWDCAMTSKLVIFDAALYFFGFCKAVALLVQRLQVKCEA